MLSSSYQEFNKLEIICIPRLICHALFQYTQSRDISFQFLKVIWSLSFFMAFMFSHFTFFCSHWQLDQIFYWPSFCLSKGKHCCYGWKIEWIISDTCYLSWLAWANIHAAELAQQFSLNCSRAAMLPATWAQLYFLATGIISDNYHSAIQEGAIYT